MEPSSPSAADVAAASDGDKKVEADVRKPQEAGEEKESSTLTTTEVKKRKPIRFHVRPQVSISRWQMNGSWMGAILNLGSNYYVTAIRALLRREAVEADIQKENAKNDQRVIGVALEAFGYRDLRTPHFTKVYRCDEKTGIVTELQLLDYHYLVSTATYKSCLLFFREDDFLPKCSYSFRYNGAVDYELTTFLKNLTSIDGLFSGTGDPVDFATLKSTVLSPSDVEKDWQLKLPERVLSDQALRKWGNPNGQSAPYGPLGL
mmetsp:Transcript_135662/g.201758  ORF Transcript_135662/g.201758 Transcript_135662/m.201758 type:complete len:261 (-) Transcript_135662:72-854(-)|eukprot:CAMPEP_0117028454 /NCGR_PEP_ID=MMETSP0472-20121206/20685_1 /TAXON_ID=693140 ORGANISM="Tiarina fusus, Strain LIS" /NCGR_SAMPLE_ID=MMETSP0472 /ASSEMBLY_ACC=CAM_ASM_000603 /LENGTH=260 /DNA_ID=CAMNT_0004735941 /DNA_START=108 /DNA_END=890 /DNA_ORIENTATION=-